MELPESHRLVPVKGRISNCGFLNPILLADSQCVPNPSERSRSMKRPSTRAARVRNRRSRGTAYGPLGARTMTTRTSPSVLLAASAISCLRPPPPFEVNECSGPAAYPATFSLSSLSFRTPSNGSCHNRLSMVLSPAAPILRPPASGGRDVISPGINCKKSRPLPQAARQYSPTAS